MLRTRLATVEAEEMRQTNASPDCILPVDYAWVRVNRFQFIKIKLRSWHQILSWVEKQFRHMSTQAVLILFNDQSRYPLTESVKLGRAADCQIKLDSYTTVSKVHAAIYLVSDEAWEIEDFESTNGTYVNGHRILKKQRLKSGDRITLSQTQPEFLFQLETQESAEQVSQTIQQDENNLWGFVHDRSLQTLTGHASPVRGVAFSPDGKLLVSGGTDKSILLWDLATGQQVRAFEGHKLAVNAVGVAGQWIASGSADKTIRIWESRTGNQLQLLEGHSMAVNAIAFHPEQKLLVSGSADKTTKIWDLNTSKAQTIESKMAVTAVAWNADDSVLAIASSDRTLKLWDLKTQSEMMTISSLRSVVNSIRFSPDGKVLAISGDDKILRLWDVSSNQEIRAIGGYPWQVGSLAISNQADWCASGSSDNTIKIWKLGS